eukprot:1146865-Pelagomonas_calceolata.AAC.1
MPVEDVSPAANQPEPRAVGQPLVTLSNSYYPRHKVQIERSTAGRERSKVQQDTSWKTRVPGLQQQARSSTAPNHAEAFFTFRFGLALHWQSRAVALLD